VVYIPTRVYQEGYLGRGGIYTHQGVPGGVPRVYIPTRRVYIPTRVYQEGT